MDHKKQMLRFCIAGAVGIVLYYAIFYVLTDIAGWWYIASAVIASFVNYGSNFILQKCWTFNNKNVATIRQEIILYLLLIAILFVTNLALLYILVEYVQLRHMAAQVIATIVCTIVSYVVSQRIFVIPLDQPLPLD